MFENAPFHIFWFLPWISTRDPLSCVGPLAAGSLRSPAKLRDVPHANLATLPPPVSRRPCLFIARCIITTSIIGNNRNNRNNRQYGLPPHLVNTLCPSAAPRVPLYAWDHLRVTEQRRWAQDRATRKSGHRSGSGRAYLSPRYVTITSIIGNNRNNRNNGQYYDILLRIIDLPKTTGLQTLSGDQGFVHLSL